MTRDDDPKDPLREAILARRARFVAAALSASGLVGCGGDTADATRGNATDADETASNSGPASQPTPCLSIAPSAPIGPYVCPTPCLSPPTTDFLNPTSTPPTGTVPFVAPTPCLEPPVVPITPPSATATDSIDVADAGAAPPPDAGAPSDAGSSVDASLGGSPSLPPTSGAGNVPDSGTTDDGDSNGGSGGASG
jgi:hypothetical protein